MMKQFVWQNPYVQVNQVALNQVNKVSLSFLYKCENSFFYDSFKISVEN